MAVNTQLNHLFEVYRKFQANVLDPENSSISYGRSYRDKFCTELNEANTLLHKVLKKEARTAEANLSIGADHDNQGPIETLKSFFSFGPLWDKKSLIHLLRGANHYANLHKPADIIRSALTSMAARMQNLIQLAKSMHQRFFFQFRPDVYCYSEGEDFDLKFGQLDSYSINFKQQPFSRSHAPRASLGRDSDQSYSMTITPLNLKLEKKLVEAKPLVDDPNNNVGGWCPGSLIHTISIDEVNKQEGDLDPNPLTLEIGVKKGFHNNHEIWTKVLHKSAPGSSDEDIIIEDRLPNTDAFQRSLGLSFFDSFFPEADN